MQRILRDVYEIDLFDPPPQMGPHGVIPDEINKIVWERYSQQQWQEIGRTYNVTQVVTRNTEVSGEASLENGMPVDEEDREQREKQ